MKLKAVKTLCPKGLWSQTAWPHICLVPVKASEQSCKFSTNVEEIWGKEFFPLVWGVGFEIEIWRTIKRHNAHMFLLTFFCSFHNFISK